MPQGKCLAKSSLFGGLLSTKQKRQLAASWAMWSVLCCVGLEQVAAVSYTAGSLVLGLFQ